MYGVGSTYPASQKTGTETFLSMSTKVTMNLSEQGLANTDRVMKILNTRTRTQAVESALSLAALILERINSKAEIVIEEDDGRRAVILIPGVTATKESAP